MSYRGDDALVCPLLTLLYWRFTGGLYYELIAVPEFANEFGEGIQAYVGEVVERACPTPMEHFAEREYVAGKSKKRSVDWIVADATAGALRGVQGETPLVGGKEIANGSGSSAKRHR